MLGGGNLHPHHSVNLAFALALATSDGLLEGDNQAVCIHT